MIDFTRIDRYLTDMNLVESREKSKIALERGYVRVNGEIIYKPSFKVTKADVVELLQSPMKFVSRGGEKLEKAILHFHLDFKDKNVLDVGASTGGFTDCALQYGASKVTAVDIGSNQIHLSLKNDKRITILENTDIRKLGEVLSINTLFDVVVADVSFISLSLIMKDIFKWLKPQGFAVLLVKPQFEQDKRIKTNKGIIKDEKLRNEALEKIQLLLRNEGLNSIGVIPTDADGKNKNVEYLICIKKALIDSGLKKDP